MTGDRARAEGLCQESQLRLAASRKDVDTTLSIDVAQDMIHDVRLDLKVLQISLIQVFADVTATNQGVSERMFDYRSHVPEGTPVITEGNKREKK